MVGTVNGLTVTKPEHNHGPCELSEERLRKGQKANELYEDIDVDDHQE